MLLEPTSFKLIWLGCYHFSISIRPRGHANTLRKLPRNAAFDLTSTVFTAPSCLLVGAHMHCLLSCQVYISGSILSSGETIQTAQRASQLLASLGGCQLNMIWVAQIMDFIPPWLTTQVIKCSYGKEGEQRYTLVPGGLASWIEMALRTWQAMDPALTQQH